MHIEHLTKSTVKELEALEEDAALIFYVYDILARRKILVARHDTTHEIMGVLCYTEKSGLYEGYMGIGYLETVGKFKNQGVSKTLMYAMFEEARKIGRGIRTGRYDKEGELYLKHTIEKLRLQDFPDVHVIHH